MSPFQPPLTTPAARLLSSVLQTRVLAQMLADAGHQVALRAGAETTITVRVTAEDPARRQTYTVKVYRERATKSEDNNLTSLRLSAGTLTPAFNRDTTAYTAQVAANVTEVTVSYTASDTAGGSSVVVVTSSENCTCN